jgi:hypothetical protein
MSRHATAAFVSIVAVYCVEVRQAGAIEISSVPLKYLSNCLTAAIEGKNLRKKEQFVEFWCQGDLARQFYDYIGGDKKEVLFTNNDRGFSRKIGNDSECFNIVESATEATLAKFSCHLRISAENIIDR